MFSVSDVLLNTNFDLFTVSVTSSVSSPSTVAVFLITFVKSSPSNGFTVTSKLTVVSLCAPTFTSIPLFKFPSV